MKLKASSGRRRRRSRPAGGQYQNRDIDASAAGRLAVVSQDHAEESNQPDAKRSRVEGSGTVDGAPPTSWIVTPGVSVENSMEPVLEKSAPAYNSGSS